MVQKVYITYNQVRSRSFFLHAPPPARVIS